MEYTRYRLIYPLCILLAAALPCAGPLGAAEPLAEWQRFEMESSGRVDTDLIKALDRAGKARLIAVLEVRSDTGDVLRTFRSAAARESLWREGEAVLVGLPEGRFELIHRYRAISSLAGETDAEGVLALLEHPAVAQIGLDRVNPYNLAEAIPVARIQQVRGSGKHGKGVWVAVLDSGVDTNHPDLKKQIKAQQCFCSPGCCPNGSSRQSGKGSAEDDVGHGTLVTGVIASKGKVAPRGAAMKAKVLAMKVGDFFGPRDSDVLAALDFILTEKPEVAALNMSFGSINTWAGNCDKKGASNRAYSAAIKALRDIGITSFAGSGNAGSPGKMGSPACIGDVISVGAVYDESFGGLSWGGCSDPSPDPNELICFTDRSKKTDLVAPGFEIVSSAVGGGVLGVAGTSFASPMAVGCTALLKKKYPDATPDQIEEALESSSTRVDDPANKRSYPALDCREAFDFLGDL